MFIKIFLLSLMMTLWSCNNPTPGDIPFSANDTYESIRGAGTEAYIDQQKNWREARDSEASGEQDCGSKGPGEAKFAQDFLRGEKKLRESEGGPDCRCIPMGELCLPKTCHCDEICPNHHGILRGKVGQMAPTEENSLAFENSTEYNGTAYKRYPNKDGFCSGNNAVLRKFQMLSDMQPNMRSWPAMKKGSPEWRSYILGQIERLGSKEAPEFLGVSSMVELGADPEFREALKTKGKYSFGPGDSSATEPGFWRVMFSGKEKQPKFTHPTSTDIPARTSIDPDTGKAIPTEGTPAYHSFIEEKVKKIASGHPASLPGYSNIHILSSNPTYMEIMGAQAAIDWQTFNEFEDESGFHGYSSGVDDGENKPNDPMSPAQLKVFMAQARAKLPLFPDTYPKGKNPGEAWNENGPFQTLPVSIRSSETAGGKVEHAYHSIEAWAMKHLPPKGIRVCMKDPNNVAGQDDNCKNYLDIPDPDDPSKVYYKGFSGRTIGKFNFTAYGTGHVGSMTDRLIAYCRRVKASSFRGGPCSK